MSKASLITILFFLASQAIAQSEPIEYDDPINPDGWPSLSVGLAADFHTQYVSIGSSPIEKGQDADSRRVTLWANYTHPVASTL